MMREPSSGTSTATAPSEKVRKVPDIEPMKPASLLEKAALSPAWTPELAVGSEL
jgi:hypothetical protein